MKDAEQKSKFIELRAKGLSYDKISAELNISKPTLLKWKDELYQEIANAEFSEMQSVLDKFKLTSKEKVETLSKKLKEIYTALEKQDVTSMSMKDLLQLKDYLESQLEKEKGNYKYYTGKTIIHSNSIMDYDDFEKTIEQVVIKLE